MLCCCSPFCTVSLSPFPGWAVKVRSASFSEIKNNIFGSDEEERRKSTLQLNILIDILKIFFKGFKINVNNSMHQRAQAEQYLSLILIKNLKNNTL